MADRSRRIRRRQPPAMQDILVLGPQFRAPNLRPALERAGLRGPVVSITAGWQEREGELAALVEHLGTPVRDLRLYERAEAIFGRDPALHAAYRKRQNELRRLQDLYRLRLDHAKAALRELWQEPRGDPAVRRARRSALSNLRRLDAEHLRAIRRVHERFDEVCGASRHPLLAAQRAELDALIAAAGVVCVAGGHLPVLLNRMRLFGLGRSLAGRALAAWSAGAMALSERVVLYHDHPPQGAGNAELFEAGLGLVPGVVFLPHAATRLAIDDEVRVELLARRFAPAICRTLDDGDILHWHGGRLAGGEGSRRLTRSGRAAPVGAPS